MSAISRILFSLAGAATICLCDQYPGFERREQRLIPYLVLLREGFAKTERITPAPGGLLPRLFTLTGLSPGGLFSAVLSFPRLMVPGIPPLQRDSLLYGVRTFLQFKEPAAAC